MRAVIQRVKSASVTVEGEIVSEIRVGLLVFLGVAQEDTPADVDYMASKIANLRIFEDDEGRMNLSILDIGGEALVVSQFTLYGDCRKGGALASFTLPDLKKQIRSTKRSWTGSRSWGFLSRLAYFKQ